MDGQDAVAGRYPAADVREQALARLREEGGRITPARRLLLDAITSPGHHTAGELAETVRASAPGVHVTTIYRNLDELERLRLVDRTYISNGPATYHMASVAHGHLACESCGAIADLPGEAFAALHDAAMSMYGFEISPARFAIPGRCARCT